MLRWAVAASSRAQFGACVWHNVSLNFFLLEGKLYLSELFYFGQIAFSSKPLALTMQSHCNNAAIHLMNRRFFRGPDIQVKKSNVQN